MLLAWLALLLLAAAPAAAAPIQLAPASGEAGARATLTVRGLPPHSRVELRVGAAAVKMLRADGEGLVTTVQTIPRGADGAVRVALQDTRRRRAVLRYRVRSRWSGVVEAGSADWRARTLRLAADLRRGKLYARAVVAGLAPGERAIARYLGARVGAARAGRRGRATLRMRLPQDAAGVPLEVRTAGAGGALTGVLPRPPAVVVAAADIACAAPYETTPDRCRHAETAALARTLRPDAVLLAGDIQYEAGRMSEFRSSFHRTWGRLGIPFRPVPGNHEYRTPGAAGYFDYFEWQSGWRPPAWYGYDLGPWRLLALNSNCEPGRVDCRAGSPQERWLRATLAAEPRACTLAYWHHPRYSSGFHGSDSRVNPFWRTLLDARAEAVVAGHDHHYERFAPQDDDGQLDESGMRQFVVGTGGSHASVIRTPAPHSAYRQNEHFGVLVLRLYEDAYSWRFVALGGQTLDYGRGGCQ